MLRVGLTGGIACGKSTVLQMLQDLGAATISADSIVHELLDSDTSIRERIRREFGEGVFDETGRVDRRKLADIAFRDDSARMKLERILHPEVRRRILVWMDGARSRGTRVAVAEVPLLFEAGLEGDFDCTVAVTAEHGEQLNRLSSRMPVRDAERRIAAQMPAEEKARRADYTLVNSGSLDDLQERVRELWSTLLTRDAC
ncbi:MAG: dephospho-CoA kinase [Armatimonadota bacterium]